MNQLLAVQALLNFGNLPEVRDQVAHPAMRIRHVTTLPIIHDS